MNAGQTKKRPITEEKEGQIVDGNVITVTEGIDIQTKILKMEENISRLTKFIEDIQTRKQ